MIANIRYRVGDVDRGGQASAAKEGILANLRDRVGDKNGGYVGAAVCAGGGRNRSGGTDVFLKRGGGGD